MIKISIVGGSGYSGGELLRLLLDHPGVSIQQVTSERFAGKPVHRIHPNLRKRCQLKFSSIDDLQSCDFLFLCLPHGKAMTEIDRFRKLAPSMIDLSGDFRLQSAELFEKWYGEPHSRPELLTDFIYGIPEINRSAIQSANLVTGAGCNATATILALRPLFKRGLVEQAVVEVKAGSSEGGNSFSEASHHPERSGAVRSYKPTGHRHIAEMLQNLGLDSKIHFSATSIEMVRGILATSHVFLNQALTEKDVWKIYREDYTNEPFIRIVKERAGIYRYPEPKLLSGTNYCDIGFEIDPHSNRLVVMSAIDNLMKGAAGQAVQCFNLMNDFDEQTALGFSGLHPI
ncbi:MAG: N-acetyl-gamma-glutamyl-phosphate/LysW-gamma-L-alpha-aminoadipyl-6-phosphate reductase [Parasphingorhabdus sp.]|jgi:N-acetyl-gamma-glutamyl-phosphate/LysW-gamma-L-alpha-aminoadipyl-6-phosphate reductase